MKLKLIEKGFETFAGNFGGVDFEDGVSVREVTTVEAQRIANIVRCETLEGFNPSSSQVVIDSQNTPMSAPTLEKQAQDAIAAAKEPEYTRAMLEAIADEKGINGLREIGEKFNVKSTSIAKLIQSILDAQSGATVVNEVERTELETPYVGQDKEAE